MNADTHTGWGSNRTSARRVQLSRDWRNDIKNLVTFFSNHLPSDRCLTNRENFGQAAAAEN